MQTHLTLTYLNRSGARFSVKIIINQQMTMSNEYNILNGQTVRLCSLTAVCLHYTSSYCAVLIRHSNVYTNTIPPSLALQILSICPGEA